MANIMKYTAREIAAIIIHENVTPEEYGFLTAVSAYGMVGKNPATGVTEAVGIKPVDVVTYNTDKYPTGIFRELGRPPIIVLNDEDSILDYDFISELHPMHDWDIYLWADTPYIKAGTDIGIFGEWYRRDYYPDGIEPFVMPVAEEVEEVMDEEEEE